MALTERKLSHCQYPECRHTKTKNRDISFYKFPKDRSRFQLWCSVLKLDAENVKQDSLICSDHFLPEQFKSPHCLQLRSAAVPLGDFPGVGVKMEQCGPPKSTSALTETEVIKPKDTSSTPPLLPENNMPLSSFTPSPQPQYFLTPSAAAASTLPLPLPMSFLQQVPPKQKSPRDNKGLPPSTPLTQKLILPRPPQLQMLAPLTLHFSLPSLPPSTSTSSLPLTSTVPSTSTMPSTSTVLSKSPLPYAGGIMIENKPVQMCLLCANVEGAVKLSTKPFNRINTATPEDRDVTLVNMLNFVFPLYVQGETGLKKGVNCRLYPHQKGDPGLCKECAGVVRSAYLGLKGIKKRMSKDGILYDKFLKEQYTPDVHVQVQTANEVMSNASGTKDLKAQVHFSRSLHESKPLQARILDVVKSKDKRLMVVLCNTIRRLVAGEMSTVLKQEKSCFRDYYDENGFIPPDSVLEEKISKHCPITRKVLNAMFHRGSNNPVWNSHMSTAFLLMASSRERNNTALQRTISFALHRIGVPKSTYEFMHKLGLSLCYTSKKRYFGSSFQAKISENFQQPPTTDSVPNEPMSPGDCDAVSSTTEYKNAEAIAIMVNSPLPLSLAGKNLPIKRLCSSCQIRKKAVDAVKPKHEPAKVQGNITTGQQKTAQSSVTKSKKRAAATLRPTQGTKEQTRKKTLALFQQRVNSKLTKIQTRKSVKSRLKVSGKN